MWYIYHYCVTVHFQERIRSYLSRVSENFVLALSSESKCRPEETTLSSLKYELKFSLEFRLPSVCFAARKSASSVPPLLSTLWLVGGCRADEVFAFVRSSRSLEIVSRKFAISLSFLRISWRLTDFSFSNSDNVFCWSCFSFSNFFIDCVCSTNFLQRSFDATRNARLKKSGLTDFSSPISGHNKTTWVTECLKDSTSFGAWTTLTGTAPFFPGSVWVFFKFNSPSKVVFAFWPFWLA